MEDNSDKRSSGLMEALSRLILGRRKITEEEIQDLIDIGEEEGLINEEENDMIRSIFELRDRVVREIMVPRNDMVCVHADANIREVLDVVMSCGHSRIPVYDATMDDVIGVMYAKDLLKYWGQKTEDLKVRKIMRPPYFVPETKNFEQLLQEFKRRRVHIAIVMDEYGGTSGLVTIEDLIEQIVGDIQDEYDLEEEWLFEQPDGSVVVDARLPVEDLGEHFDIAIEREKFDTVGGLIFHITGRIPRTGEVIETDDLVLTIIFADERRIGKVRVARVEKPADETEQ